MKTLSLTLLFCAASTASTPKQLDFVSQQLATQQLNQLKAISTPEIIDTQAAYFRKMYLALVKSGFDEAQAMSIITAMASSNAR